MKKNLLLLSAVALALSANAQLETTNFVGAFAPAPTEMWTNGWAEWDPQNKVYGAPTAELSTEITANTTLTNDKIWLLKNKVYVSNNATLTIQPGTIIRGDKATEGAIIIKRGSKIMAEGTAAAPIVFTSNFNVGERAPGDWGGIVILGNAVVNQAAPVIEGGFTAIQGGYGGTNDDDNSGVIKYVRIEFAGFPFQPDKEINGLTMGGVGRNTVIDYVQASYTNDDSFEWYGGTVNAKHLVAYRGVDDDFDTDFGYSGTVQYAIGIRDPQFSDQCTCSTSEGFESDNDANGTDVNPRTSAQFKNITLMGPLRGNTAASVNSKFQRAARIRKNSQMSVTQSIFMDWPQGVVFDGTKSELNAKNNVLTFKDNVIAGMKAKPYGITTSAFGPTTFESQAAMDTWFTAGNNTVLATTASLLTSPYSFTAPDYRPGPVLTSIENTNIEAGQFNVFPNPATSQIEIALNNSLNNSIVTIQNTVGSVVASQHAEGNSAKFDVSNLNNGVYIVSVRNGNNVINKTLVINK